MTIENGNTHRFYKVLTPKGLQFVIDNSIHPHEVHAAREELRKRSNRAITSTSKRREIDGYEKDR